MKMAKNIVGREQTGGNFCLWVKWLAEYGHMVQRETTPSYK